LRALAGSGAESKRRGCERTARMRHRNGINLRRALRYSVGKQTPRQLALDAPATYLNWNFILISIPNLVVIGGMIVVFILALIAPFPGHAEVVEREDDRDA
jgi:hypothetical protein